MKQAEDFIGEITLGNASAQEIKSYIRSQAARIRQLEARLEFIALKEKECTLARKRQSLARFIERNHFF
ncbi:MAG: hypothetical protein QG577_23, partial [Thermodesulfobacteriota bacterium]|nr:hypothetical protein [Thermodesulfobacteriota bacterium]